MRIDRRVGAGMLQKEYFDDRGENAREKYLISLVFVCIHRLIKDWEES